jgi:hypothetical protein
MPLLLQLSCEDLGAYDMDGGSFQLDMIAEQKKLLDSQEVQDAARWKVTSTPGPELCSSYLRASCAVA